MTVCGIGSHLGLEGIADHHAEELEDILDSQRVIERMREAGTEPVTISTGDLD